MKKDRYAVEVWIANGRTFFLQVFPDSKGWVVYTAIDSIMIATACEDAEKRLGLLLDLGCKHGVECTLCETERMNAKLDDEGRRNT